MRRQRRRIRQRMKRRMKNMMRKIFQPSKTATNNRSVTKLFELTDVSVTITCTLKGSRFVE